MLTPRQCYPSRKHRDRQGTRLRVSENDATRRDRKKSSVADLSDILVPDSARLLDVCGALGDLLEIVTAEDELILLVLGSLDINTVLSNDLADDLLAQEVADLNLPEASLAVLVEVDVDGEMGVDVAHLVLEAF